MLSTEMLSAKKLPRESETASPYLVRTPEENPMSYQLLVFEEQAVEPAIDALHRFGADVVDLNLGCPAPRVCKAGGGGSLVKDRGRVRDIVTAARRCTKLPLTAKLRIGDNLDEQALREVCMMLEGEGVDLLTIHARLSGEAFCRRPRWNWVGKVKEWVSVPVVANGGIDSAESALRCLEQSGADGLMIGRAAAVQPWLFASIAQKVYGVELEVPDICLPVVYRTFLNGLMSRFRPERRLGRLKEFTHYFALNYSFGHHLASRVQSSASVEAAWNQAVAFFRTSDADGLAILEEKYGLMVQEGAAG